VTTLLQADLNPDASMPKLFFQQSGSGPLVLLLHPVGLDRTFWAGLPERLAETHMVIAVDTAGHGNSPDAVRPGRMQDRIDDIVELLSALNQGPATLLGVSFGGMIAQQVALARPDLVSGLILAGCPGAIPATAQDAMRKRGADAELHGMSAVTDATLERWFTPDFLSTDDVRRVADRLLADKPSNWAAAWEAVAEHDALERLKSLDIPALVIAGEKDAATSLDAKRALAAAIPGSRLTILPGAPHIMQIECPDAFAEAVTGFLNEQKATS
jgi:3-oxoadipate enol-lactonase